MVNATEETDEALDARIAAGLKEIEVLLAAPTLSRAEVNSAMRSLEWGGRVFEDFNRFMYSNYGSWQNVTKSFPYNKMHQAINAADKKLVPEIARQIASKGIGSIYSMGPSSSLDKLRLEELVVGGGKAVYHPIDVNVKVVSSTLDEIALHLDKKFGNDWRSKIRFGTNAPTSFAEVKSEGPSCVIYDGGTIMNSRAFWEQAARIAQPGGLVVASSAVSPHDSDLSRYWLKFYDTPEGKKMFEEGLSSAFPELFTPENRGKWEIAFEYVNWPGFCAKWAMHQTPKVSIQLKVKENLRFNISDKEGNSLPFHLMPTMTWKEVVDLESRWEDPEEKQYPIELCQSTKLDAADFLYSTPQNFGLKCMSYVIAPINFQLHGKRGAAMSAIFEVGKPSIYAENVRNLEPPSPRYALR